MDSRSKRDSFIRTHPSLHFNQLFITILLILAVDVNKGIQVVDSVDCVGLYNKYLPNYLCINQNVLEHSKLKCRNASDII